MFEEEITPEDEDDEAKKNEETKHRRKMVSYPYPNFKNSYDILPIL